MSYAGDVSCKECWKALAQDKSTQLVDVRTNSELNFVGRPKLDEFDKRVITVEWQSYPSAEINPDFVENVLSELQIRKVGKAANIYLLCRSGGRSRAAAKALTSAGFIAAFNVAGGFEGETDKAGHRGNLAGWKFDNLPWVQP